jgi:hypothetical protein
MAINQAWCVAATIAADLLCWLRLLCLDPALAEAEPKTLRYRLLHPAARIVRPTQTKDQDPGVLALGARAGCGVPRRVRPARTDLTTNTHPPSPTRATPPARGTGAPNATVASTRKTHTRNEDHKRR